MKCFSIHPILATCWILFWILIPQASEGRTIRDESNVSQDSLIEVTIILDFQNENNDFMIQSLFVSSDSKLTVFDIIEKAGILVEYDSRYNSPPLALINKIEGHPNQHEIERYWALFTANPSDSAWDYPNVGIAEIEIADDMVVAFCLTSWNQVDEKLIPNTLPRTNLNEEIVTYVFGSENKASFGGCGGGGYSGESIRIGKYSVPKGNFHREIKPRILKDAGNYQYKVGNNPDIGISGDKITLSGNGPFQGKVFETTLNPSNYFK